MRQFRIAVLATTVKPVCLNVKEKLGFPPIALANKFPANKLHHSTFADNVPVGFVRMNKLHHFQLKAQRDVGPSLAPGTRPPQPVLGEVVEFRWVDPLRREHCFLVRYQTELTFLV